MGDLITFETIDKTVMVPAVRMETVFNDQSPSDKPFRLLVVGQMQSTGTATANTLVAPTSESEAAGLFGYGSQIMEMWRAVKRAWKHAPLAAIPMDDPSGTAAIGHITFATTATAAGEVDIEIGDMLTTVAYASGDTPAEIATAVAAAITTAKKPHSPVTVAVDGVTPEKLNLTAKNTGALLNELKIRVTFRPAASGTTATVVDPIDDGGTDGVGALDLDDVSAAIKAGGYNYVAIGVSDSANGLKFKQILLDLWDGMVGKPTVGSMGTNAAYADQVTLSGLINAKHLMLVGDPSAATFSWVRAAEALARRAYVDATISPADALQMQPFTAWKPAFAVADRLSMDDGEVDTLLKRGVSPCYPNDGGVNCLVLDVWNEHKDAQSAYIGPLFFTRSGICAARHYRVLARIARSRFGAANWPRRVVTQPTQVTAGDGSIYWQSEQSKAFALMAYDEDKKLERDDKMLNFVADLGFANYQHEVDYASGQARIASDVYPAPPLIVINCQQRAQSDVPELEE